MRRELAAEAIGSFILFATVIGSGVMAEQLAGGNVAIALIGNTLATGAILYVLIAMFGLISAHFNPAVTLVMRLRGEIGNRELIAFPIAQIVGGVLGVWAAHLMFDLPVLQFSEMVRGGPGQWLGEFIATGGLVLTILGTRAQGRDVAASVALYITAAYWFTSSTSFANPAITLARALSNTFAGIAPASAPAFIAAQLAGAVAGMWLAGRLFEKA